MMINSALNFRYSFGKSAGLSRTTISKKIVWRIPLHQWTIGSNKTYALLNWIVSLWNIGGWLSLLVISVLHACTSVIRFTSKDNVVSKKQRVLFSSQPFWRSTTEIRCCLQPFKQNSELVLLDSIAAAVESQTIINCEQLRNISNLII